MHDGSFNISIFESDENEIWSLFRRAELEMRCRQGRKERTQSYSSKVKREWIGNFPKLEKQVLFSTLHINVNFKCEDDFYPVVKSHLYATEENGLIPIVK